jgi:hypothetical protein
MDVRGWPWAKNARPYLKNKLKVKRTADMAQVVEHLPKKLKVLSLNLKKNTHIPYNQGKLEISYLHHAC